ncbi:MAG TPA: ACP phosphodiesterase [Bacteroidales bacterium]|nr:ACP phosphodiesterase [Bacteroidales bacterium]
MNYLAHLFLAGNDTGKIVGNFIADAVKGDDYLDFTPDIRAGIIMHRRIDAYTDSHPVVRQSISRLRPNYHKFSGVVVDMFYDHFLAANWNDFSEEELPAFTSRRFAVLMDHFHILPHRMQYMLPLMIRNNWLLAYASMDGLNRALAGISRRTSYVSGMEHAVEDLKSSYRNYQEEFMTFFPQLQEYVCSNGFDHRQALNP